MHQETHNIDGLCVGTYCAQYVVGTYPLVESCKQRGGVTVESITDFRSLAQSHVRAYGVFSWHH